MDTTRAAFLWVIALAVLESATSVELTFELQDNAKDCFFEYIQKNTSCTLEFQVSDFFYGLARWKAKIRCSLVELMAL